MKTANCLSINGGGCKGLIALHQIDYLYQKMGGKFFRHFDYIGGTSTGALITALIATGRTPKEIIDIYEEELPKIFKKGCLRTLRGKSKYSNEYIKSLAHKLLGNITLGELKQHIIIPALNSSLDTPKYFKSEDPKDADYKLVDVIIASAAAPTYFPAYQIEGNWYKDGGLFANNPAEDLLKECRQKKIGEEKKYDKINILSITTGANPKRTSKSEIKGNLLGGIPMLDEMLHQQDLKTDGSVWFEYNKIKSVTGTYLRCESEINNSSGGIDDVSRKNIMAMKEDGLFSTFQNKGKLDAFYLNTLKND
jgi:patatin-like phospholipase/acyl hydrolase